MKIIKKDYSTLTNKEFAEKYNGMQVEIKKAGLIGTVCGYYNSYKDDLFSVNHGVLLGFNDKGCGWPLFNRNALTDTILNRNFKSYYYYAYNEIKFL